MVRRVAHGAALIAALVSGCRALDPPARPEQTCMRACEARATQCSRDECLRGCNLALDRLVEREGDRVVACVADSRVSGCGDRVWSRCAVRIGVHADGGPPALPQARDYEVEDEEAPTTDGGAEDDDNLL